MIISHKHKFIFIKTTKTAGTSLELFLHPHCGPTDIITRINAPADEEEANAPFQNELFRFRKLEKWKMRLSQNGRRVLKRHKKHQQRYYPHITAWEVKKAVGDEIWNTYYKFCVVRNPYDRAISHYFYRKHHFNPEQTFDEYLAAGFFGRNAPLYCDWNTGELMMDRVVRFETLNEGLSDVFQKLDIPFDGTLGVRKRTQFRKENTDYETFLTDNQKARIREIHKREFELFGY